MYLKKLFGSLVLSGIIVFIYCGKATAQSPFIVELKTDGLQLAANRFYVADVIDGRKDSLNNGFAFQNKKRTSVLFKDGAAKQFRKFLDLILPPADSSLLGLTIKINKLLLTERPMAKGNIVKAELTVQFQRKDGDELIRLNELSSWMEQSMPGNASQLQEKNIREILVRMLKQFDKLVAEQKSNALFAPRIEFRVVHDVIPNESPDTIFWDKNIKLSWNDFKGKPTVSEFAAQSNCAFSQRVENKVENGVGVFIVSARAAFFKRTSWVKEDKNTIEVLAHEQLHFDIAELHMRMLRKNIIESKLNANNYTETINRLYDVAWKAYSDAQTAYDDETSHGTITDKQLTWQQKVADDLKSLENY